MGIAVLWVIAQGDDASQLNHKVINLESRDFITL